MAVSTHELTSSIVFRAISISEASEARSMSSPGCIALKYTMGYLEQEVGALV